MLQQLEVIVAILLLTAVIISSYFVSGSFHHWAGCLEDGVSLMSLLDMIELND